jgi:hypothetical protein
MWCTGRSTRRKYGVKHGDGHDNDDDDDDDVGYVSPNGM